jgi:hypothetical protein
MAQAVFLVQGVLVVLAVLLDLLKAEELEAQAVLMVQVAVVARLYLI